MNTVQPSNIILDIYFDHQFVQTIHLDEAALAKALEQNHLADAEDTTDAARDRPILVVRIAVRSGIQACSPIESRAGVRCDPGEGIDHGTSVEQGCDRLAIHAEDV